MMKYFNWGYGLILVFVGFSFLIGTLVYKSMNTKFELVSKEYYKDELRYQDKIDGKANAAKLSSIKLQQTTESIILQMPTEQNGYALQGDVWFYCATNATKDVKQPLSVNGNQQVFSKQLIQKGNYMVKITWQAGNEKFYAEREITVQ